MTDFELAILSIVAVGGYVAILATLIYYTLTD